MPGCGILMKICKEKYRFGRENGMHIQGKREMGRMLIITNQGAKVDKQATERRA